MDGSQYRKNAPKQVYVPVHRRKEMETKEASKSSQPSINSEEKHKEGAPIKRKGRGQFKASAFDSYIASDSNNYSHRTESEAKQSKENTVSQSKDTKDPQETEEKDSIDDVISKIGVLKISEDSSTQEDPIKRDIEQRKPSSRDRNTPGRDPSRPATSDMVAKRLIHGALGIKLVRTPEQRKEDRELLQKAKEERQQKKDLLDKNRLS